MVEAVRSLQCANANARVLAKLGKLAALAGRRQKSALNCESGTRSVA